MTSRYLHLDMHFVDPAHHKMYRHSLRMAIWGVKHVGVWQSDNVVLTYISALVGFYEPWYRSRYSDSLQDGQSGDRIPVGTRFSALVQTCPGVHPASYTMDTGSFPGGKAAGAWRWPPTSSSADVKERVGLYLYSPSGSSWPVLRWTLPLHFTFINRIST